MVAERPDPAAPEVLIRLGARIPMRDGVELNATVYLPSRLGKPAPAIFIMTPYIAQTHHDQGMYFAANGYPFVAVDVRGRGDSEGVFRPLVGEAQDGFDIVEWLSGQPFCDGQVAMWGGSYCGYVQWATAKECPPHLATIVPAAAPSAGFDFPMCKNIPVPYGMQWLTLVAGRTLQDKMFWNNEQYWHGQYRRLFESGGAFNTLDAQLGTPSTIFQEWLSHPHLDDYWDRCNPTPSEYARISCPVLTITGTYDANQPGALRHYREHLANLPPEERARHFLVIGPWDHAGTRNPAREFCGLTTGPESLVDLRKLHLEWYAWVMQGGTKPAFLRKNVAYYVTGAEVWRYADTLENATARSEPLYLHSIRNPDDVFDSGALQTRQSSNRTPDHYVYDPRDVSLAALESTLNPENLVDQRMVYASRGKLLVYHTAPFETDTVISGFFRLSAWLSIDQPDTDFCVAIYEIGIDGRVTQLSVDRMRARYREGLHRQQLIETLDPLLYEFDNFNFVARLISKGCRLRLIVGPSSSIYWQKNYNSGGVVATESIADARTVTVELFHDEARPSALYVPYGEPQMSTPW